ncbi:ABC transporter ATP-binding protein [Victivallis vadensis]|jgi:ABC transporter related protein|uniref:ABC transporter ATP-binding protein n=1 Tax=Victivallis vadensis TaxID=172901 RepID=UPI000D7A5731|nr:ABC transporter ATP-binding protein [Victivallis vadensis]PWM87467.1 MAG: thiamine ABC transporter permease [Lentisphaerota bacterium]HJH05771.1 ABC transporter ATP-binding protein/permease [Victivallis vadensis]
MQVLRKFIRYYRPYRWMFYTDTLCALTICVIDLAFPQILNVLTHGLYTRGREAILPALVWIGAGLLAMYILRYFCQYYITTWGHVMGARMESDMRQDLFDHYQRLSFSYYDRNNTGVMMAKLISDLFDISELAHHGPENLIISTLKIVGAFTILMFINFKMTLILIAVTLVMAVFSYRKNRKMRAIFLDNRKKIAGVNAQVQDSLSGIRVVKSFANEEIEREKFADCNGRFLTSKVSSYKLMGVFHAGNGFFQGLLYISILVSGGYFVAQGTLAASELAIYALYVGIFLNPIEVLINFTEQFQKGYSGFRRFTEVVETQPEIEDSPDARPLGRITGEIELDDVSFSYTPENPVLEHVSLTIPAGKTIALVGPSGGGKTTLCSLIPRFYDVTGGAVKIDGNDVRDVTGKSLRSAIGIVQQEVYLFGGTLRENIAYGRPGATDEEIVEAAKRANIHDFIMSLPEGYDTSAGERGTRLSGGQKQRISIARVFLKNPAILILDEATSALDNDSERHIQAALEQLASGRTTVVIAHRLSTIRKADEIVVIANHGIAERGTHSELLERNGIYAKYYYMQFEGLE